MNFTKELGQLMIFTGNTAMAIRMYSAYGGGSPSGYLERQQDPEQESIELMFLADALHHFLRLGAAIQNGTPARIIEDADYILEIFTDYEIIRPEFGRRQAKPVFDTWARTVSLTDAREAITGIRNKAAAMVSSP